MATTVISSHYSRCEFFDLKYYPLDPSPPFLSSMDEPALLHLLQDKYRYRWWDDLYYNCYSDRAQSYASMIRGCHMVLYKSDLEYKNNPCKLKQLHEDVEKEYQESYMQFLGKFQGGEI